MGNVSPTSKKTDSEIIELLMDIGVPKKTAKTLTYLSHVDESISRSIEENTNLRQPEVSTALKELRGRGWIEKQDIRKEGKGRPIHLYKLAKSLDQIFNSFEKEKLIEVKSTQKNLHELKKIVKN